jgi:xanthine dehydrogenase iron-sulfur cluster and FAD-binding subunit A
MDQPTVMDFVVPPPDDPLSDWREGDAWLAGGTLVFYTPMPHLRRLRDLSQMGWPSITVNDDGLELAATCGITELHEFVPPAEWTAGPFLRQSVEEYLAGFKVWNRQTVGGNICASLPAGPMVTMGAALEAQYTLWAVDGSVRVVPAIDFVTDNNVNILEPGELLRSIHIPLSSLMRTHVIRRFTLTKHGRSSIYLVGTADRSSGELLITVSAATIHPVHLRFAGMPSRDELTAAIDHGIPNELYFDDPNGTPAHRRHMTHVFAQQIRAELSAS